MPSLADIGYDESLHNVMVESVRKAGLTTLPEIIKALASGWVGLYGFEHVSNINTGTCEDFAHDVRYLFPDADPTWDDEVDEDVDGSHCFVIYDGRYYDAEVPEGVDDWRELPYFQRLYELQAITDLYAS